MTALVTRARYPQRMRYSTGARGLGQDDGGSIDVSNLPVSYPSTPLPDPGYVPGADIQEGGTYIPPVGTASSGGGIPVSSGSGFNLNSLLNSIIGAGTKITTQLTNPLYHLAPGTYYQQTPYGTVVATAGAPSVASPFSSLTSSSMLPLLLIGGGVLLVVMMAKK